MTKSALVFDPKMSDAEALMWRMEQDPFLSSTFASITVLKRPADYARLRRTLERATWEVRRLRQRVQPAPANITTPTWVDDPDFDINWHVRHISLPKPGTRQTLFDLAMLLHADPLDRSRPLWQFWVIDGLRGGKGAILSRMHHTMADGEASLALSLQYLDFEPDAPERPPADPALISAPAEPPPIDAGAVLRDLTAASLRMPLGLLRQVRDFVAEPSAIPTATHQMRDLLAQLRTPPTSNSTLWAQRSLRRALIGLRIPLASTKAAAKRLGGTVNTAFLTAAAQAAGDYHRQLGQPVDSLHASMAVSTRTESSGSNAFSLARMAVPTGEMPVAERFAAIHHASSAARAASPGLDSLATIINAVPTSVLTQVARQQAHSVDFATSNVRASPIPLYIAGAEIEANYPIGPLLGVAFNATLVSYRRAMDVGINCDAAAVTDTELLRACFERAFDDLRAAHP